MWKCCDTGNHQNKVKWVNCTERDVLDINEDHKMNAMAITKSIILVFQKQIVKPFM